MKTVLYFINYNDSFYFPFIKRHYGNFCHRIVMFDNYSTDNSVFIAKSLGFEVRDFGLKNHLNDQHYIDVKNHCWKECRGKGIDYVIVCDADEFIKPEFEALKNAGLPSAPSVLGYNMISEILPVKSVFEIDTGEYSKGYSKQAIFSPDRITDINYVHGCHKNYMQGDITIGGPAYLYHYRMIGGVDRMIQRHSEYRARMSKFNKQHKMGFHYEHSDNAKRDEWNELTKNAIKLWN